MSRRYWLSLVLFGLLATAPPLQPAGAIGASAVDSGASTLDSGGSPRQTSSETLEPVDVALDPGHSSWDVGASGAGLREFELTLDVAQRARQRLESAGYRVRLTRQDDRQVAPNLPEDFTEAIRIEQLARQAAAGPARVFVSIHFNGHPDRTLRGTETYFNGDNYPVESRVLAALIQVQTRSALTEFGYEPLDRGVREDLSAGAPYGHFFTLRGPFPSALVEVLFLSNSAEAMLLQDTPIRDAAALGIARGIISYLTTESNVKRGSDDGG
jgi:N-acetylmuramoyl-L-alanine amidase